MESDKKYSLLRLIVNAGLEEDLMDWLSRHGYRDLYGRLDNIPTQVIEKYVDEKKLLIRDDEEDYIKEINNIDVVEERNRGYIRARKSS